MLFLVRASIPCKAAACTFEGGLKMSKKRGLVYGVGVNDWVGNISVDGKLIWEYVLWRGVLQRCFDEKYKQNQPFACC